MVSPREFLCFHGRPVYCRGRHRLHIHGPLLSRLAPLHHRPRAAALFRQHRQPRRPQRLPGRRRGVLPRRAAPAADAPLPPGPGGGVGGHLAARGAAGEFHRGRSVQGEVLWVRGGVRDAAGVPSDHGHVGCGGMVAAEGDRDDADAGKLLPDAMRVYWSMTRQANPASFASQPIRPPSLFRGKLPELPRLLRIPGLLAARERLLGGPETPRFLRVQRGVRAHERQGIGGRRDRRGEGRPDQDVLHQEVLEPARHLARRGGDEARAHAERPRLCAGRRCATLQLGDEPQRGELAVLVRPVRLVAILEEGVGEVVIGSRAPRRLGVQAGSGDDDARGGAALQGGPEGGGKREWGEHIDAQRLLEAVRGQAPLCTLLHDSGTMKQRVQDDALVGERLAELADGREGRQVQCPGVEVRVRVRLANPCRRGIRGRFRAGHEDDAVAGSSEHRGGVLSEAAAGTRDENRAHRYDLKETSWLGCKQPDAIDAPSSNASGRATSTLSFEHRCWTVV